MQEPFHIWFERSGGFTGIANSIEVSSDTLDPGEADRIREMIDHSGFFDMNETDSGKAGTPDQFQYQITIEYKNRKKTLRLSESDITEHLQPLIDYLNKEARLRKRKQGG
jgi:hypothetical protein